MTSPRDEYVDLIFDRVERERVQRKNAPAVNAQPAIAIPAVPATLSAADREFEAVRDAALVRMEAEKKSRKTEAAAAAEAIFEAFRSSEFAPNP